MSSEESSDLSDSSCEMYLLLSKRRKISSDDERESDYEDSSSDNCNRNAINEEWFDPVEKKPRLKPFLYTTGIDTSNSKVLTCQEPIDFYSLLVTDEIFETIACQTNLYANEVLTSNKSNRLSAWYSTDKCEIKRFFGLIMWMGLVKLPTVHLYWSKDVCFEQSFPRAIMSRNRFEMLLRMIQFAENKQVDEPENQLLKIKELIDALNTNFKEYFTPGEIVCVSESIIPFHGRIIYRQHIKDKQYRHGIKLIKLCTTSGYTYSLQVHPGKTSTRQNTIATSIVMSLCENIIGKGHVLCTDNCYINIDLAKKLIEVDTYLIGTLRTTYRSIPTEMKSKILKPGEIIVKENKDGIIIFKLKDKEEVYILSTKHSTEMVATTRHGNSYLKPKIIIDYNEGKSYIDQSNQMSSHINELRKTIKWYKRLAFEVLLNTSVVNAMIMFNSKKNTRISCLDFKRKIVMCLTARTDQDVLPSPSTNATVKRHEMETKEGKAWRARRQCRRCYEENVKKFGRQFAKNRSVKVVTFCKDCDGMPHYCLPCFNIIHRNMSN
ncbi:piggyBac transposable element-derived protein 4-like [Hylaeus anthracinus]|uniref:piggyBac transposable element-derived protein 4-like n=1 Tax=Hylaeus anthracinus TaxID=313031 RepID=UPI0023BA2754|nr:piggyBac transposable element-derived protein 4-like [Hylaeus anthracinus]